MVFRKNIIFFSLLSLLLLILSGCGDRTGELYPNTKPIIYITSYGGVDSLSAVSDSILFRQTIYWEAYDTDGVVEAFSYRILNEAGEPIATPGNEYTDADGWVLHYQDGADESIPKDDPAAQVTIWTNKVYVSVNFPANGDIVTDGTGNPLLDENGNFIYQPVVSIFQIKCLDDRGDESDIFEKYFRSHSVTPSILAIQSTQGVIDKKRIGTGVIFDFTISDDDPLIGDAPNYFIFKIEKIDIATGAIITESEGGYPDYSNMANWLSTRGQSDVTKFMMTQRTNPPLQINTPLDDVSFADSTFLTVIAYDLAGIASQPKTISFAVKDGFYPGSLIYQGFDPNGNGIPNYDYNDCFAMGDNHYTIKKPAYLNTTAIAEEVTPTGYHYAMPMWITPDGRFAAFNSPDLKLYMHWGHEGEYGKLGATNESPPIITNRPFDQKLGLVIDERTKEIYFSEMKYYDLQLDGEAYHYPPLPAIGEYLHVDSLGSWLRVPIGEDIAQRTILYGLEAGDHVFKVRAVDLSDEGDPTPAEFHFTLVDVIPPAQRAGILILDDEKGGTFSPDATIDDLYLQMLASYSGEIVQFDFMENSYSDQEVKTGNSLLHFDQDVISPTVLQQYKLVIYHSDLAGGNTNFHRNANSFRLYFEHGGNMIASLGDNAQYAYERCNLNALPLLEDNFGIARHAGDDEPLQVVKISSSPLTNPFMMGADPADGITTPLDLELDDVWLALVGVRKGLGPCSYFHEDVMADVVYTYRCKAIDAPDFPPTQEQYDQFHGKNVAIKYSTATNTNYLFGFSLPFMEVEDLQLMFNEILADYGM